ncbi:MAG: spore germination protein [Bacillus sp. (in: Bacteria)]|nr:spore germination protein [Bacillus sp. (in: firmicutes)]
MQQKNKSLEHCNEKKDVLVRSLESNIDHIKQIFKGDETLILRKFQNKYLPKAKCCVIYFDGMVNTTILNENIIQPIMENNLQDEISSCNLLEELEYKIIISNQITKSSDMNQIVSSIISGDTVFLLEGYDNALIIFSKGGEIRRPITEPDTERVVRGPREGFTESIMVNLSLIRRKINNQDLKLKFKELGERTHTKTCICYIEGLVLDEILIELEQRLDMIEIDGVLDSGYIQELIRDAPFSPFETVGFSERPDVVASKLLEGRIALVVDGSPFVLTVPFVLIEGFQANEDYYTNYIFSTFNRLIRTIGVLVATSLPAMYLALACYHQEMLPTPLLLSISSSQQGVPFPTVITLLGMLLVFDVLRETGTRMPTAIGQAVNIVGSLVLGQAAVEAKLVSAPVVIITALSGMMSLLSPTVLGVVIMVRFFLLIFSSFMGIYGYLLGMLLVILHLLTIRSFGIPYTLGFTSMKDHNGQDIWIRSPWWSMTLRPKIMGARNLVRQTRKKSRETL